MTPNDAATFDWKRLYQIALLETNPEKIQDRVVDAQRAILKRGNQLRASFPCPEHQELNYAMRFLRLLQDLQHEGKLSISVTMTAPSTPA